MLQDDPSFMDSNTPNGAWYIEVMKIHGHSFRTFRHGALHGVIGAITFALPVLGINALFERKGFKYIAIHLGYWVVSLALMGSVLCHFV